MKNDRHIMRATPPQRPRRDEGIALVLALMFVVLLTVIVVEFTYEIQVDATLVERHTSDTTAYMAAKSSIALSMSILAADVFIGEEEAAFASNGEIYDSLDEPWAQSAPLLELNGAMVSVQIDDEYGKLNLNALLYEEGELAEVEFEPLVNALTYLFEMSQAEVLPVDVILDWLDSDDETRPLGAENDYYEGLETPFECKNGPMDSLEELLLLPGITPEMFFGDDSDEAEFPLPPLAELFTVHGHPEGKINVNTAMFEILEAMFAADARQPAPAEKANEIMQRIEEQGPYVSIADLRADGILEEPLPSVPMQDQQNQNDREDPNQQPKHPDLFDVASSVFRIHGDGQSGDAQTRIEAFVWRDTHGSNAAQMFRVIDWRVTR